MRIIREQGLKWLCVGFFLGIAFVGACSSGGTAIAQAIIEALDVVYDNSASGLQATNVQAAIDEVHGNQTALGGTVTVLDAEVGDLANLTTTTQASLVAAINEVAAAAGGGGGAGGMIHTGQPFMSAGADTFSIGVDGGGGESRQTIVLPRDGVLASLFLRPDAAPAGDVRASVRINGQDTALSVTHSGATDQAGAAGNIGTTLNVSQGDLLTVHFETISGAPNQNYVATFEYR